MKQQIAELVCHEILSLIMIAITLYTPLLIYVLFEVPCMRMAVFTKQLLFLSV